MARPHRPTAPRPAAPDLPRELDIVRAIAPRDDLLGVRLESLSGDIDASHARIAESVVAAASLGRLDLTGAILVDIEIEDLRAAEVHARSARWRNVRVTRGRVGTLDLSGSDLSGVELRGIRIDYLALGGARIDDLLVADCTIGTIDLPLATVARVRFENSCADDVDTRGLRLEHLDLRGLEALSYTDPATLRGATLTANQVERLALDLAAALGIHVAG